MESIRHNIAPLTAMAFAALTFAVGYGIGGWLLGHRGPVVLILALAFALGAFAAMLLAMRGTVGTHWTPSRRRQYLFLLGLVFAASGLLNAFLFRDAHAKLQLALSFASATLFLLAALGLLVDERRTQPPGERRN